jgi:thiamine biosynthesis lipoprotein
MGARGAAVLLGLVTLSAIGSACASPPAPPALHVFDGASMGTTYTVRVVTGDVWDSARHDRVGARIQQALDDVESKMSTYLDASELSRFNQTLSVDPFPVSPETFEVVSQAYALSELTGGALDITVGPLVNAWGFGPVEPDVLPPDRESLTRLRGHLGYRKLELDPAASTLRKTDPELQCDLSAVAKGYGVDRVATVLREDGLTRFMVEVGGEVVTRGLSQRDGPWRIAIERPLLGAGVQRVVPLSDQAMATSGDYRNVREVDGRLLSHTIDPRTGRPVEHRLASVTVVAESGLVADGLATALNVLGPDEGYALAAAEGWAVLFLVRGEGDTITERATPAFESLLE